MDTENTSYDSSQPEFPDEALARLVSLFSVFVKIDRRLKIIDKDHDTIRNTNNTN